MVRKRHRLVPSSSKHDIQETKKDEKKLKRRRRKKKMTVVILGMLGISATFFIGAVLIIILVFFPFLLWADPEQLAYDYKPSSTGGSICSVSEESGSEQLNADGVTYFWPVPTVSRISSPFGNRDSPGGVGSTNHKGIDISIAGGGAALHPIYAVADGTVILAGPASGYGQVIYIQHAGGMVSKYGHLDSKFDVKSGDSVKKGQRIGRIGAGIVGHSTGPHLHFQIEVNGTPINPLNFVTAGSASGIPKAGTTTAFPVPAVCTDAPALNVSDIDLSIAYRPLNIQAMHDYLSTRNGVGTRMASLDILKMVDRVGKEYGLDPYLLLAITGAEQSFVPNSNPNADKIIRNPWNTFGSWQNTDNSTEESARYAAKAIVKLQTGKPANIGPIQWMNQREGVNPKGYYAADPKWANNVTVILEFLVKKGG